MRIEEALSQAIVDTDRENFRKSVRGLLTKTLLNLGIHYSEAKELVHRYVIDYKVPIGMKLVDYVSTLAYQIMQERGE